MPQSNTLPAKEIAPLTLHFLGCQQGVTLGAAI